MSTAVLPQLDDPRLLERRRRGVFFLCLAVGCVGFSMFLQMSLNHNFLVDEIHVSPKQIGYIESARESCGILAFVILALLAGLAESMVAMAVLLLVAVGLGSYALVAPNYLHVLLLSLVWSQGLHVWMPLPNSMALGLAEKGREGYRLGQVSAAGAAGSFLALLIALPLMLYAAPIRPMYLAAGAVAVVGAVFCFLIPRQIKTEKPRVALRARYWLYYLLSLLEGWRKQLFLCFAGFLLVKGYGIPAWQMLILWGVSNGVSYFSAPVVGKLIDRVGERRVLVTYYVIMIFVFAGYAVVPQLLPGQVWILQALFVADSVFFVLAMALTTYAGRIAPRQEHTSTLSAGVAMNHVAAVLMPLIGGLLWEKYGSNATFLAGSAAAVLSIVFSLMIPKRLSSPMGADQGG